MRDHITSALRALCAVGLAGTLAAGCGGIADPSKNVVENFTGTLQPFGVMVHEFDVQPRLGEYTVTIVAASPTASSLFAIYLGQVVGTACSPITQTAFSVLNQAALTDQISRGHYCIAVADPYPTGYTTAQTYTLRVSHP